MAKKKRRSPKKKKEEEEYEFVPPEFDEREFLENDIFTTKVLGLVVVLAVVLGIFAYFLTSLIGVAAGALLLFVSIGALGTILQIFRVNIADIEKKTMIGNYLTFIFLFLAVWIIAMNPPISDYADPEIGEPVFFFDDDGWSEVEITGDNRFSFTYADEADAKIEAEVVDNGELESVTLKLRKGGAEYQEFEMVKGEDHIWSHEFKLDSGAAEYDFRIVAVDTAGNEAISDRYEIRKTA